MATFAGIAAETDCCGNLYPLHVPLSARHTSTGAAWLGATTIALAARTVWTVALVCAWSGPSTLLRAGLL
jgi:hypothetical protein